MNLTVCPPCGPGSILSRDRVFQGIFPLANHILPTHPKPMWEKMVQIPLKDTTQPVDCEEEGEVQLWTDNG